MAAQLTVKVTGGIVTAEGQRFLQLSTNIVQCALNGGGTGILVTGGTGNDKRRAAHGAAVRINVYTQGGGQRAQLRYVHCIVTVFASRYIADHFIVGIQTIVVDVGVAAYLNTVAANHHLTVAAAGGNAVNSEVTRQIEGDVIGTGGFADFNVVVAVVQVNGFVGTDIAAVGAFGGQVPAGIGGVADCVQLCHVHRVVVGYAVGDAGNHVAAVVQTVFRQAYRITAVGRGNGEAV